MISLSETLFLVEGLSIYDALLSLTILLILLLVIRYSNKHVAQVLAKLRFLVEEISDIVKKMEKNQAKDKKEWQKEIEQIKRGLDKQSKTHDDDIKDALLEEINRLRKHK